ncbi:DUF1801 domain-containing protein [Algibacter lectus]|uniref:Uncharacterized protein DUF1801 n=1 Tax=Algibacter lectus TaxID=221126 RepID=A0A090VEQ2_9FLAO|nr:DUF1801 domain-containing protein [Algibacter lectus]MDO7136736.1 DUF1801 domain-containing protein [Algibacter lectus]MWW26878.1 DUF1801 domain-containing protein [Algibacter lectus]TDY63365.1 uncharacterized protein DUF1801 [Algibacter lectus]SFD51007.1 protein of unknown function (DU1801) [Algibacter lectus]GAL61854.1 hypothetical protein JCM19300_600 [Algibacter lectus]
MSLNSLDIKTDARMEHVFNAYPEFVKNKILHLRALILDVANNIESINTIEETLKWGEPSYLVKKGSTLRIDWKPKKPDQYAMYFKCTSKLVETFKIVFKDNFEFEGHRAIVFQLNDTIPETELKQCITAALTYHNVKQLPFLGL